MTQFVKINLNDIVYDKELKVEGKVKFIDKNIAKIEVILEQNKEESTRTTQLVESRLFNLVVVSKGKKQASHDPNKYYNEVRRFHQAFEHPISNSPIPLPDERVVPRTVWAGEELVEFLYASSDDQEDFDRKYDEFLKGLHKAKAKSDAESDFNTEPIERITRQSDAIMDALFFKFGNFVEMGVLPDKIFDAVQSSNMSKLFKDEETGKLYAKYRESDGKILKSENFFPPEGKIKEEIERQLNK